MATITARLNSPNGLHMRPAGILTDIANKYNCDIKISSVRGEANAKSVMEVMMLAILHNEEITIIANGHDDEKEAVKKLKFFVENEFKD